MSTLNQAGIGSLRDIEMFPVAADTVIGDGDMVWFDSANNTIKSIAVYTFLTSNALTRRQIRQDLVGVAIGAHRTGDAATLMPVAVGNITATCESATPVVGTMFGVSITADVCDPQKLVVVKDPREAVAISNANYTGAVTTVQATLCSTRWGVIAGTTWMASQVFAIGGVDCSAAAGVKPLNTATCGQLCGGRIEILALGFAAQVALTVQSLVARLNNGANNTAALTVTTANGIIGKYNEADLSADAFRVVEPESVLSLELTHNPAPTVGSGTFFIRYRRVG